ncbi:MAG: hypothetical protein WC747_00180 [Candidatus Babeliales bacterium]|jgi:hypothetical protein
MKKCMFFLILFAVGFVAQPCLASDKPKNLVSDKSESLVPGKPKKFIDPVALDRKEVISTRTLNGGLILTLYSDGSSQTKYPNGKCVDHPPMLK